MSAGIIILTIFASDKLRTGDIQENPEQDTEVFAELPTTASSCSESKPVPVTADNPPMPILICQILVIKIIPGILLVTGDCQINMDIADTV